MGVFHRIDKWMNTAPISLIMLLTFLTMIAMILGVVLTVVWILPAPPPQKIEVFVDPPKVKIPKE